MAFGFKKYAETLLLNSMGASKVVFKFGVPPLSIEFDKDAFLEMLRSPQIASQTIAKCFVRRRIFYEDFMAEPYQHVITSLKEIEPILDVYDQEMSSSGDIAAVATAQIVRAWNSRVVNTRQQLVDQIAYITKEKAEDPYYDTAGADRHKATKESLIDLRVKVYPLIKCLCDLLDDNDPTKSDAMTKFNQGAALLSAEQIRNLDPDIEVV